MAHCLEGIAEQADLVLWGGGGSHGVGQASDLPDGLLLLLEISSTDPPYGGLAVPGGRNTSVAGQDRARVESALWVVVAVADAVVVAVRRSAAWKGGRLGEKESRRAGAACEVSTEQGMGSRESWN